jgi:16S rRNA (guanine966-N2)-methyltransferase
MRISGGAARGIPLLVPAGSDVRPSTDSLRQAVFSSLAARLPGARFLDLFAGSGAFGLEAFSRGAIGGVFVERNRRAVDCLRRNLTAVCKSLGRTGDEVAVLPRDVFAAPFEVRPVPDLVFVDPPFPDIEAIAPKLFARLSTHLASRADALVIFKMPGGMILSPPGWSCVKRLGSAGQPNAVFFRLETP